MLGFFLSYASKCLKMTKNTVISREFDLKKSNQASVDRSPLSSPMAWTKSLVRVMSICIASGLMWFSEAALAQGNVARSMANLIDKNAPEQAYALGVASKGSAAIKAPEFDLWFGVAALEVGEPTEGLAALRRFMQTNPTHTQIPRARVELGRALLVTGDWVGALAEFRKALEQNPPPNVAGNIKAMILLAEAQMPKPMIGGHLEFGVGHDSNINGGTSTSDVTLPVFGLVTLDRSGVKTPSRFTSLGGAAEFHYPLTSAVSVVGSVQGEAILHDKHNEFDLRTGNLTGGLVWRGGTQQLRALLSYAMLQVDGQNYRESTTLTLVGSQAIGKRRSISISVGAGELRYENANALRNARVSNISAGYQHAFDTPWQPVVNFSLGYGEESNTRNRPDLGRNMTSSRVALTVKPASRWSVSTGYSQVNSRYQGTDSFFLVTRDDTYRSIDVVTAYAVTKDLSVRLEANKATNGSNVALWQNAREQFAIKMRYGFR